MGLPSEFRIIRTREGLGKNKGINGIGYHISSVTIGN